MRRGLIFIMVLLMGGLFCYMSSIVLAQVEEASLDADYSWGTVSAVSDGQIVVKEYDYEKDAETDVTYLIDSKTSIKNVDSIANIAVGDNIEIDYVLKDEKKVAVNISVEKETAEKEGVEPAAPVSEPGTEKTLEAPVAPATDTQVSGEEPSKVEKSIVPEQEAVKDAPVVSEAETKTEAK